MVCKRLVEDRLLLGDLANQMVEAFVAAMMSPVLSVDVADELIDLLDQAAQVLFATGERGAERLGDVLNLADAATVEQQ